MAYNVYRPQGQNKEISENLLAHLQLGKPLGNKRRRQIGSKTTQKYMVWLSLLDKYFNQKPFTELTQNDIDRIRGDLRQDKILKGNGKPYLENSKKDLESKFLKVLLSFIGKPELALYVNNYRDDVEIPSISREAVEKIVSQCKLRDKVIFQILFDGGFRASEFLNCKFADIKDDALASGGYYKFRITKSKTTPRTVGLTLPLSGEIIKEWLSANPEKVGTQQPLIELSYQHLNATINNISKRVLGKRITAHQLRHSSATYYCHYLNQYQLNKRYGWAMASDMAQRYISREGVDDEKINNVVVAEENLSFKRQVNILQEQLNQKTEMLAFVGKELSEQRVLIKNVYGFLKELKDESAKKKTE